MKVIRKRLYFPDEADALQYLNWDSVLTLSQRTQIMYVPKLYDHPLRRENEYDIVNSEKTVRPEAPEFIVVWSNSGIQLRADVGDWILVSPTKEIYILDPVALTLLYEQPKEYVTE